jgi:hypothetical protein
MIGTIKVFRINKKERKLILMIGQAVMITTNLSLLFATDRSRELKLKENLVAN